MLWFSCVHCLQWVSNALPFHSCVCRSCTDATCEDSVCNVRDSHWWVWLPSSPADTSISMLVWCARPSTSLGNLAVLVTPDACLCSSGAHSHPTLPFTCAGSYTSHLEGAEPFADGPSHQTQEPRPPPNPPGVPQGPPPAHAPSLPQALPHLPDGGSGTCGGTVEVMGALPALSQTITGEFC